MASLASQAPMPHVENRQGSIADAEHSVRREQSTGTERRFCFLEIVNGMLAGARMPIEYDRDYTLGTTLDCEIVFRDADKQSNSVLKATNIHVSDNGIQIGLNQTLNATAVAFGELVTFGSEQFRVVQSDHVKSDYKETIAANVASAQMSHSANLSAPTQPRNPAGQSNAIEPRVSAKGKPTNDAVNRRRHNRRLLAGLSIAALLAISVIVLQFRNNNQQLATLSVSSLQTQIDEAGFDHIVLDSGSTATTISGYVGTRQQFMKLNEIVAEHPRRVLNRVVSNEEIQDQISNVLRVNGVSGTVEAIGMGAFVAQTTISSDDELSKLETIVRQDVGALSSFDLLGETPAPEAPPEVATETAKTDLGKRVVLVNSQAPAYIVTEDQSRYFLGSMLPSGHRIVAIMEGRVLLERSGEKTELIF